MHSEDGEKRRNRPKPISPLATPGEIKMGEIPNGVSQDEVIELLASLAPPEPA